jgi:hypothetical protein
MDRTGGDGWSLGQGLRGIDWSNGELVPAGPVGRSTDRRFVVVLRADEAT